MGLANEQPRNDLEMKNIQKEVDKLEEEHERSIHDGKKLLDKAESELSDIKLVQPSSNSNINKHLNQQTNSIESWFDNNIDNCREYIGNLNNSQEKLSKLSPQYILPENLAQYQRRIDNLDRRCDELEDNGEDYRVIF